MHLLSLYHMLYNWILKLNMFIPICNNAVFCNNNKLRGRYPITFKNAAISNQIFKHKLFGEFWSKLQQLIKRPNRTFWDPWLNVFDIKYNLLWKIPGNSGLNFYLKWRYYYIFRSDIPEMCDYYNLWWLYKLWGITIWGCDNPKISNYYKLKRYYKLFTKSTCCTVDFDRY